MKEPPAITKLKSRSAVPRFLLGRLYHFSGHAPQIPDDAQFRKCPDDPFRRIELPRLHAVAVVVLKFVVIVVIALAEREKSQQERIARGAFR